MAPKALPAIAVAALLVVACGEPGPDGSEPPTGTPIVREGVADGFRLVLRVGSDVYDAGAPIDVGATLTWTGPADRATVWGSGSGVVSFVLQQLDGPLAVGGLMTADCGPHEFERLVPVPIPFTKSGGFSADDPNAGFYRAFLADPVLRLPAGTWRIGATASGFLEPCEMDAPTLDVALQADVLVR